MEHSLAIAKSGELWAFGSAADGRLGNNTTDTGTLVPVQITQLVSAIKVTLVFGDYEEIINLDSGAFLGFVIPPWYPTGMRFRGWALIPNGEPIWAPSMTIYIAHDIRLYAVFVPLTLP
jgi:hypothetical protein